MSDSFLQHPIYPHFDKHCQLFKANNMLLLRKVILSIGTIGIVQAVLRELDSHNVTSFGSIDYYTYDYRAQRYLSAQDCKSSVSNFIAIMSRFDFESSTSSKS